MSSDYDDDEDFLLNLDDEDLRRLSEVEDKFGITLSQGKPQALDANPVSNKRGEDPPPLKRTKVAQPALAPIAQLSDDDTPDIFVNADGTYALDSPGPSVVSLAPSFTRSNASRHLASEPAPARSVSPAAAPSRTSNHSAGHTSARPLQRQNSNASIRGLDTSASTQGPRPLIRAGSLSQAISRGLSTNGFPSTQQQSQHSGDSGHPDSDAPRLRNELETLRTQLAHAELEREKLRVSLEQNKEQGFAKAGEAENLRRTMSKQTEQHAEELARLKRDMAEVEKAKVELERHMQQEMDKLRTVMAFKQFEGDGSRRAYPNVNSSIRKRQVPGSSQTPTSTQALTKTLEVQRSPLSSKKKAVKRSMVPPPLPEEKSFNDLTNSFARSTSPIKAQVRGRSRIAEDDSLDNREETAMSSQLGHVRDEGKARAVNTWQDDDEVTSSPIRKLKFEEPEYWRPPPIQATQEPFAVDSDVFGANNLPKTPMKDRDVAISNIEIVEPIDLANELRMLLLAHIILFDPPEGHKTFSLQHVLTVPVPPIFHQRFDAACTDLFNAFSGPAVYGDLAASAWENAAIKSSLALARLAQIFQEAELLDSLHVLLNLLASISTAIPPFAGYLLKVGEQNEESLLLEVLCNTIVRHFKGQTGSGAVWHLAESVLALCEVVASRVKDDSVTRFSVLSQRVDVLPVMLDPIRSPLWVTRVTRLLAILASHPSLARALMATPDASAPVGRVPLVELLGRHLVAIKKHDTSEYHRELYENVLTTLSQLAIADNQSLATLVESVSLIPSLASFIYSVTSIIWSELSLTDNVTGSCGICLVQNLRSAVRLLHYLTFSSEPALDIRERLTYAPRGPFNGLAHLFIVAFGRLAFSEPPEYLDDQRSKGVLEIRGLSEALLESVVDGPEIDGIFGVFRDSEEDESAMLSEEKIEPSVADEEEALNMMIDDDL